MMPPMGAFADVTVKVTVAGSEAPAIFQNTPGSVFVLVIGELPIASAVQPAGVAHVCPPLSRVETRTSSRSPSVWVGTVIITSLLLVVDVPNATNSGGLFAPAAAICISLAILMPLHPLLLHHTK